ncbi:RNA polymerase subunit sigma-24 [Spirochaetia bacterium]|nr:RNA polymerase subunit sigma-24 [Spirochaetia bacterium]
MELTDEMIVCEIISGHKEQFRILVERHERAVRGLGMSFFHNPEESADFAQEVFLKAFRNLKQFEAKSRFSTWLYRVAWTTGLNSVNRKKEFTSLADYDSESFYPTPEGEFIREVVRNAVKKAVSELPDKFRVCIDLFFFYDRTYEEIELITGFPVNTVKSHVFRAKKLLREKLAVYVDEKL